jgi:23S rRNA pseudouridine1911/1915/1917 synthase
VIVVDTDDGPHVVAEPDSPLTVRLETPEVVVVEKPPLMPTAPRARAETGTLCNALLGRYPELSGVGYGPFEPGILHRLDNGTSGLVLLARSGEVWNRLRQALSEGRLEKRYLALVATTTGAASGTITAELGPDPHDPRRVAVLATHDGKEARRQTEWTLEKKTRAGDLLTVRVTRAYRHQIRVHLASMGMPLVGDVLYGGPPSSRLEAGRHALHASYVAWAGDALLPAFRAESPLPRDLAALFSD